MKIKHLLLVALTALGLGLASVGAVAPAIAGKGGGWSGVNFRIGYTTDAPVIAGRAAGATGGNFRSGDTAEAPAIAGRPAGASGVNF